MWRKRLRLAIAVFVVVFAAVVLVSLRRGRAPQPPADAARRTDPNAVVEAQGGAVYERSEKGHAKFSIRFGKQLTYADGRTRLLDGVTLRLPDRNGQSVEIRAREATLIQPPDRDLARAQLTGDVVLTTDDGLRVASAKASYEDAKALVTIPGPVTFTKGRTAGSGVGATYDRRRSLLRLRDKVTINTAPDAQGGGALHVTAGAATLARDEHFITFERAPRIESGDQVMEADTTTMRLSDDDQRVERAELRGHARITGGGTDGPQAMHARDIDLDYAQDGRTLRTAVLMDGAVVEWPGDGEAAGRRIAGRTIDITMAADGATVTRLTGNGDAQVDLPRVGGVPARRIRAQRLTATGEGDGGLQAATFTGGVDYRESARAAKDAGAARTARSDTLVVKTTPGFADVEQATFRGRVHFINGDTTADAPVAIYDVAADRIDLQPASHGEPGTGPHVTDGRIVVDARTIQLGLTSQTMTADSQVRSLLQPTRTTAAPARAGRPAGPPAASASGRDEAVKVPAMLKQDEPVNVTANRLAYDGDAARATYTGNARLWQDETTVIADTIVIDDRTGNLQGQGRVRTVTLLTETDDKTKEKKIVRTTATSDHLLYEDERRRATYTTKAHVNGPQGDVTADTIEMYFTEAGDELDRAEAYGHVAARLRGSGAGPGAPASDRAGVRGGAPGDEETRRVYGAHLTYLAASERYTMVGTPVRAYDDAPPDCKLTVGTTLTFYRSVDRIDAVGNDLYPTQTTPIACGTEPKR